MLTLLLATISLKHVTSRLSIGFAFI